VPFTSRVPAHSKKLLLAVTKNFYGLKRSPRHWYDTATSILKEMGFTQSPHSPCIFVGTLAKHQPPVYLDLYVDDFLFFSQSRQMEKKFMEIFGAKVKCTYSNELDYFLGKMT